MYVRSWYCNRVRSVARGERGLCLRRRGAGGTSCRASWEKMLRDPPLQLYLAAYVHARKGDPAPRHTQLT